MTFTCVCSVLDIITLQNEIWAAEKEESRRGETSLQPDKRILGKVFLA